MQITANLSEMVLHSVTIVLVVLQIAIPANCNLFDPANSCDRKGCCEKDVLFPMCKGLTEDRLNYTIKCENPGMVNVSWEITPSKRTAGLIVNTEYSCYNSTSNTTRSWILSDHTSSHSNSIVFYNVSFGDDTRCTFTGCSNGVKMSRHSYCFDYIKPEDEVTIDSTCFESRVPNVYSSQASSMVLTPTSLLQAQAPSLITKISSISVQPPSSSQSPVIADLNNPNNNFDDIIIILCVVGVVCIGLVIVIAITLILACYGYRSKPKLNDNVYHSSAIYKVKPSENLFLEDFKYSSIPGSLLTLLEPLHLLPVDHQQKALMIHMTGSTEKLTHIVEDNEDPDDKCSNDNISLATLRLEDVQSLKDTDLCSLPSSESLTEPSINTLAPNHHQLENRINGQDITNQCMQDIISPTIIRSTEQQNSAMNGYISSGYVPDNNIVCSPNFRAGITASVSTDGYVSDTNVQLPVLQGTAVALLSEDSSEQSFTTISNNGDYVFELSTNKMCEPSLAPVINGYIQDTCTGYSDRIPPNTNIDGECICIKEDSEPQLQAPPLPLEASEYVRDPYSYQFSCSTPISTSTGDQDCAPVSFTASDGYVHDFLCNPSLPDSGVGGLDPTHSQPSIPSPILSNDRSSHDSSCSPNLPTNTTHELVPTHNQPSASLSTPLSNDYIYDSACIPPPLASAVYRHSQPSPPPSTSASNGYIYDSSCSPPTSMNAYAACELGSAHSQSSACPSTSACNGYICDPGDNQPAEQLPSVENKKYILQSDSYQPFIALDTATSDGYICDSCDTSSYSDTNRHQLSTTTDCISRNTKLEISKDFPIQTFPTSSDYITESSLPPRVNSCAAEKYNVPLLLQADTSNYLDEGSLCKSTNSSGDSTYMHESEFIKETIPEVRVDSTIDPAHKQCAHGLMLGKQVYESDSSVDSLQVGNDGYITMPLHSQ